MTEVKRKFAAGAEVQADGTHFRVWAPKRKRVEVVVEGGPALELQPEECGYFAGLGANIGPGTRYRFRLDGGDLFPDPASRFQPNGPHGPSEVVDPSKFQWSDANWKGVELRGQVIYEMHLGTFTREGTWDAARRELKELANCGITVIELMPVADFTGRFGWGYDGVGQYAPVAIYGTPDDFRRFVDEAHRLGVGVILDVVYNHLGPDGCYLREFSDSYFTDRYENEWGDAINYDGDECEAVRDYFAGNAAYWVDEFHIDGLRLDATQQIFDATSPHIIAEVSRRVRDAAKGRRTIIVAENEPQHTKLVRPEAKGGYGLDGLWNDDFHHSARVAVTGHNSAYYTDYSGKPQEFLSMVKYGYLYQGQRYSWQKARRGAPGLDLDPWQFVMYIQNHDQVANSGRGERLHCLTSPGRARAITALMLLAPGTPMLFQGQEFASSKPFYYFADHKAELNKQVREGRAKFLAQFPELATAEIQAILHDPGSPATFEACRLDFSERDSHRGWYDLHKDLLRLRRETAAFREQRKGGVDGSVLAGECLLLRYFVTDEEERLLLVNLGPDLHLGQAPEPLIAPPLGMRWDVEWSSEHPKYGGTGTPALEGDWNWRIPGHAAVVMRPAKEETKKDE
jgi:maltooligosyltrehalose trehalohydrolase